MVDVWPIVNMGIVLLTRNESLSKKGASFGSAAVHKQVVQVVLDLREGTTKVRTDNHLAFTRWIVRVVIVVFKSFEGSEARTRLWTLLDLAYVGVSWYDVLLARNIRSAIWVKLTGMVIPL